MFQWHGQGRAGRSRVLLVVALLVGVLLSGCFGADPSDSTDPSGSGDASGTGGPGGNGAGEENEYETLEPSFATRMHFGSCGLHGVQFAAPSLMVEEELPPGFAPVYADPLEQTAYMAAFGLECGNVTVGTFEEGRYGEFRLVVLTEPPSEFEDSEIGSHHIVVFNSVTSERVQEAYWDWGYWTDVVSVDFTETASPAARSGKVVAEDDWDIWEVHTAVDATDPECVEKSTTRVYSWGPQGVAGYADTQLGPFCMGMGAGTIVFPEPWTSDPEDVVFWLLMNGLFTGVGFQFWDDAFAIDQTFIPFEE